MGFRLGLKCVSGLLKVFGQVAMGFWSGLPWVVV